MSGDANRVSLAYVEEVTPGVTPASPAMQRIRMRSENFEVQSGTTQSQELRSDRQRADTLRNDLSAVGGYDLEYSYGAHDDFIAAVLQSAGWSTPEVVTASTISAAQSDNSFNDSANGFTNLVVGQWIRTSGFATAANNGYFKIVTKPTSGKITVSGGVLVDEVAGPSIRLNMGGQALNGTTQKHFSVEKEYEDLAAQFEIYRGCSPNTLSLSVTAQDVMTGTISFLGFNGDDASATVSGSKTAAPTKSVTNGIEDVKVIREASNDVVEALEFTLQIGNNLRGKKAIGQLGSFEIGSGTIDVTGTFQLYFNDSGVSSRYKSFADSNLVLAWEDGEGNGYLVEIGRLKYTAAPKQATGINTDVILNGAWSASVEATTQSTIRWARFPAA